MRAPRIAVAGLNPHAGEGGLIGGEEARRHRARRRRAGGRGPSGHAARYAADTLFHAEARRGYDAAVAMYHDQA